MLVSFFVQIPVVFKIAESSLVCLPLKSLLWALGFGACLGGEGVQISIPKCKCLSSPVPSTQVMQVWLEQLPMWCVQEFLNVMVTTFLLDFS